MDYELEMKRFSNHANALAYAEKKGILQTAKSMLAEGFEPALVARITKLPKKQIMALR